MTVFHKDFRYSVICLKNNFTSHPEILSRFKNEESENNLGKPSCKKIPTNLNLLIREGRSLVLISERWRTSNLDRVRVRPQRMTRMIEVFSMGVRWYKARWSVVWNIHSDWWSVLWRMVFSAFRESTYQFNSKDIVKTQLYIRSCNFWVERCTAPPEEEYKSSRHSRLAKLRWFHVRMKTVVTKVIRN
jgi:hypothetical protein